VDTYFKTEKSLANT